jgi:cytochrome c oxidase subunit 2
VGLQLTKRARRTTYSVMLGSSVMLLGACSAETEAQADRWAMPANSPATEQAVHIAELWKWAWVAALITGAVVWGLIFYASWRFRRRSEDEIPVQTRYNLPLEIFYTIFPIIMVIVFFYWTVTVQGKVGVGDDMVDNPDHVVEVVGQQWSWTFNYVDEDAVDSPVVFTSGTGSQIPTLVIPVDQITEFKLSSPDVIHSFWIPGFLMKMDVIPGQTGDDRNGYQVTPTETGTFMGKCTELCGVSHSRMLFNVQVVTEAEFEDHLRRLEDQGFSADTPLYGGEDARTQVGLDSDETGGSE